MRMYLSNSIVEVLSHYSIENDLGETDFLYLQDAGEQAPSGMNDEELPENGTCDVNYEAEDTVSTSDTGARSRIRRAVRELEACLEEAKSTCEEDERVFEEIARTSEVSFEYLVRISWFVLSYNDAVDVAPTVRTFEGWPGNNNSGQHHFECVYQGEDGARIGDETVDFIDEANDAIDRAGAAAEPRNGSSLIENWELQTPIVLDRPDIEGLSDCLQDELSNINDNFGALSIVDLNSIVKPLDQQTVINMGINLQSSWSCSEAEGK